MIVESSLDAIWAASLESLTQSTQLQNTTAVRSLFHSSPPHH